jgi:hypothetical protein
MDGKIAICVQRSVEQHLSQCSGDIEKSAAELKQIRNSTTARNSTLDNDEKHAMGGNADASINSNNSTVRIIHHWTSYEDRDRGEVSGGQTPRMLTTQKVAIW